MTDQRPDTAYLATVDILTAGPYCGHELGPLARRIVDAVRAADRDVLIDRLRFALLHPEYDHLEPADVPYPQRDHEADQTLEHDDEPADAADFGEQPALDSSDLR